MHSEKTLPVGDFALVDGGRRGRIGQSEAIYAPGKTVSEVVGIASSMLARVEGALLVTRVNDELAQALVAHFGDEADFSLEPDLTVASPYRTVTLRRECSLEQHCSILTAGTSDLRVAWECRAVLRAYGVSVDLISDVGVAGLERTLDAVDQLGETDIVIVVAGMEGALASVIGGLVSQPVIAVPTSTGYGSSFDGITALLAMSASCAQGVSVVGIDNGFGAASAALRICRSLQGVRHR